MSKEHLAPTIESVGSKYLQDLQERIQSATKDYKTVTAFNRDFSDLMALGYTDDAKHKEALNDPAYLEGLVTKKSYYTLIKDLQSVQDRIQNKLIALPEQISEVDRKKIEHSLSSDAANLKRIISLLEKPEMRRNMLNMEKKSHGLHEDYLIGDKSISSLDFLGKLSKKKLSVLQLGRLYPMLMRTLTDRKYFRFTDQDRLKNFEITKTFRHTDIVRSPFGPFFVSETTTNLIHGSIEQDLVLLKVTDEVLFDTVWSTLSEAIIGNASEKALHNTDRDDLLRVKDSITKAAKKLIDYQAGGPPDKTDSSPARPTELTPTEEARRQELLRLTNGHNPSSEIPLLNEKLQSGLITEDEKYMLNLLTELQNLENRKADLSQDNKLNNAYLKQQAQQQAAQNKKFELEAKRDELRKIKVPTQDQLDNLRAIDKQIEELDANEPFYDKQLKMSLTENQKKSLRFIGESIYESMMKTADSLSGKEQSEEKNIAFWSLRFIQSCHSIQTYLADFYKPLLEEERKKLKESRTDHDAHHDHADSHDDHAVMEAVEKKMQTIISSIITNTLSPVIESGGEPSQDFEHQQGHLAFQGQPPISKLHIVMRALTRLKMEGSRLKELPEGLQDLPFVNAYRRQDKVWDPKERRFKTEYFGRVQHEIAKTGEMFFKHARDLEEFFEVFFKDIVGSNDIRAQIVAGKDFYKEVHSGKLNVYSRSKQFDVINNTKEIGPEIAAVLPTCKTILMSYFAEMGWLTDEELERDLSSPKSYLNSMVGDFMKTYYPHYSDNKRNMITYIAVKQAYLHSMYQLTHSNTRYRAGFSGGKHAPGNMYFNDQVMSDKFAGSLSQFSLRETIDHKNFAKGGLHAPSGGQGMAVGKRGFEAVESIDNQKIQNYNDVLYGGIMYDLSGEYGRLLQKFNPKFEHNLPDSLQPQNRFRNGSDDNLRGWRQLKKSKDNVSHILYTYGTRKDWVVANDAYTKDDHFTLIWKSVENLGTNYLRTWTEDLMLGKYQEGKFRDLNKFLFRRYFQNTQLAGVHFGSKILSGSGFESATTDEDFASLVHNKIMAAAEKSVREDKKTSHLKPESAEYKAALKKSLDSESEDILKDVFYRAHMVLMAERTPTILMDATNSWSEQTGVTLLDDIKMSIIAGKENKDGQDLSALFEAESSPDSKNERFASTWIQAKRDLLFIQQNARKETIAQMMKKREAWEAASAGNKLDSNTFGDFSQDHSDIELLQGSGKKGFVITNEFIRAKLGEHYASVDPVEREKRIDRVLAMRKLSLQKMLETPDLPDFNKLKAAMESRLDKADKAVSDSDKAKFKAQILANIGSNEAEYRAKHAGKLVTRSRHFMDAWKLSELTFEPEADAAENFMWYENADANHMGRMAGIIEVTTVKSKADLAYDAETSINEAIKNWGKDPMKAIDTMAEYLNKYYHTIEDERGDKFALDYKGWYVNRCMQMAMEEEEYRRGLGGVFNDVRAILFKQNKKSFAGGKNQPFTSQALSAFKTREVIRYMIQKKLIGAEQGNAYMKQYRATNTDIFFEALPRVGLIALGTLAINLFTTAVQKDSNLKSSS